MKARWISLGVAIGLGIALTVGFASTSDRSRPNTDSGHAAVTQTAGWAAMEAMHESSAMQQLHAQMPAELRAQCEAMHAQMEQMMSAGGMMDGNMSAHHLGMSGGGPDGHRIGNPGGMMGPGSGTMIGG